MPEVEWAVRYEWRYKSPQHWISGLRRCDDEEAARLVVKRKAPRGYERRNVQLLRRVLPEWEVVE